MSNSTYLTLTGKGYWCRVFPENKDATGFDDALKDTGGQYVLQMTLDSEGLRQLTEANSQTVDYPKVMQDDDGNDITTYKFKRQHEKYSKAGALLDWASGAPKVTNDDGQPWDVEEDGFLGNGTELEIRVCVYKAGPVVGTRLESIKVLDLVAPPVQVAA